MKKTLETKLMILQNFAEYYWSDEKDREKAFDAIALYVKEDHVDEIEQNMDAILDEGLEEAMNRFGNDDFPSFKKNIRISVQFITQMYSGFVELKHKRFENGNFGYQGEDRFGYTWNIITSENGDVVPDDELVLKCDELNLSFETQNEFFDWQDDSGYELVVDFGEELGTQTIKSYQFHEEIQADSDMDIWYDNPEVFKQHFAPKQTELIGKPAEIANVFLAYKIVK